MSSESTLEKAEKDSKKLAAASREEDERDDEEDENESDDSDDSDDGDDDDADEKAEAKARAESYEGPREKVVLDRPSSGKMIWTVASREVSSYLHSPITYIVVSASLVIFGLWFFYYRGGFWQVDRASMARLFDGAPIVLCGLIALFTMRSLSDEKRVGTIELLITMPVKDSEVIIGKFLGSFITVMMWVGLVALYPILMFTRAPAWHLGDLDWNPFWVGILGLTMLSLAGTAIGVMWSSFTESQILSFFATALTLTILYAIGQTTIVEFLQGWPGDAISFISLQTRFEPFARGLIDTRAIIYFLSLTVLCLMVAFRALESRKWS
ncbi:MAG: ABC transporter permease subunit [Deltaproteobacteria bacterium]|nr:ABC transporter permease subunit [Deltaproteobacteria bacterium]